MLKRPMSKTWYMKNRAYQIFILRELSSVFNALYVVFALVMLWNLMRGKAAFDAFLAVLWSPAMIPLHVIALGFALLHTITWFNATGKAIVVRFGEERLPESALAIPNYIAWAAVTAFLFWFLGHG